VAILMVSLFTDVCGTEYDPEFSMGDHMFTDLALSRDLMTEYHRKFGQDGVAQKLSAMVLQRSFWPFGALQKNLDLPFTVSGSLLPCATSC
jgi:cullin 4